MNHAKCLKCGEDTRWGNPDRHECWKCAEFYKPCDNPLCDRLCSSRVAFCCHACGLANDGKYEIHEDGPLGHHEDCTKRHRSHGFGSE